MLSRVLVPLVLVTGALGERANLCFTAHGKTSLQCTRTLLEGPIDVYDDTESPQKARKLHYKNGKLCDGRGCKKCMSTGGAWVACGRATRMPVSVARANGDSNRAPAVLIALAVVAVPVVVFSLGGKLQRSKPTTSTASVKGGGAAGAVVDFLLRFAGAWWFPLVAAMGSEGTAPPNAGPRRPTPTHADLRQPKPTYACPRRGLACLRSVCAAAALP